MLDSTRGPLINKTAKRHILLPYPSGGNRSCQDVLYEAQQGNMRLLKFTLQVLSGVYARVRCWVAGHLPQCNIRNMSHWGRMQQAWLVSPRRMENLTSLKDNGTGPLRQCLSPVPHIFCNTSIKCPHINAPVRARM